MLIINRFLMIFCCTLFLSHIARATEQPTIIAPGSFTATGQKIYLQNPGIAITTIDGWKGVHHPEAGITLKMEGPEETISNKHLTLVFRPNLSIRTIRQSDSIDRVREISFIKELNHQFTQTTPLTHFKIESSKIVNYNHSSKAIEVTATYFSKEQKLLQTHLLIASQHHQYIITFTDLYQLIHQDPRRSQIMNQALYSLQVSGTPPQRYNLLRSMAPLSVFIVLIIALMTIVRKFQRKTKLREFHHLLKQQSRVKPFQSAKRHHAKSTSTRPPLKTHPHPTKPRRIAPIGLDQQTYDHILDHSASYEQSQHKYSVDIPVLNLDL